MVYVLTPYLTHCNKQVFWCCVLSSCSRTHFKHRRHCVEEYRTRFSDVIVFHRHYITDPFASIVTYLSGFFHYFFERSRSVYHFYWNTNSQFLVLPSVFRMNIWHCNIGNAINAWLSSFDTALPNFMSVASCFIRNDLFHVLNFFKKKHLSSNLRVVESRLLRRKYFYKSFLISFYRCFLDQKFLKRNTLPIVNAIFSSSFSIQLDNIHSINLV